MLRIIYNGANTTLKLLVSSIIVAYHKSTVKSTVEEGGNCDMRVSSIEILKTAQKIASIAIRAVAFYILYWCTGIFSFGNAECLTGYTYPENPFKSDYPAPLLYDLVVVLGPYVFCFVAVATYDLIKSRRKNV
jgi:hypothetical protein